MTSHEHHSHDAKHEHGHHGHEHGQHPRPGLHRNKWLWLAVILMLLGMFGYVATMNEEFVPGNNGQEVPAAPAPAAP